MAISKVHLEEADEAEAKEGSTAWVARLGKSFEGYTRKNNNIDQYNQLLAWGHATA